MRKIFVLLALCLSVLSLSAQTGEAIYVYRNDGGFNAFLRADIDSITYSPLDTNNVQQDDMATQVVWTADGVYRIPLSAIDSMKFSKYITPGVAIDLGLSVKWANCNVGASSPEGYGGNYAWGETEEKSNYEWDTYQYYNSKNYEFINIGSSICGTQYDVARVKWGGSWRMPTIQEQQELCVKCTWKWTTYNGVNGQLVTGPNGNSIFLPTASYRLGTDVYDQGSNGFYWSGTLGISDSNYAYSLYFDDYGWSNWSGRKYRKYGLTVRPVAE